MSREYSLSDTFIYAIKLKGKRKAISLSIKSVGGSMKVLMICQMYKPAIGGVENHVEKVTEKLAQKGYKITILTASHKFGLKSHEQVGNSSVQRIPFRCEKNPFLVYLWVLRNLRGLNKYDVVHVHDPIPLLFWYLPLILLKPRKHVYVTFHGFERDPVPWVFKILRKIARRLSYRVICIGSFIEKTYRVRCDRVLVGAVGKMNPQNGPRAGLVFVGRVESDTGVIEYLDLLQDLEVNHGVRAHLTVCGGGSLESDLVSRAEELRVDLRLKGVVDEPQEIVGSAQVCLAGGYLSILEAMFLGVPVIALAQTELKWRYYLSMRDAGGPISIQTTHEGAASEINRLLTNSILYQYISTKGQKFASTMTWERMAQEYISLWKS
jgi:glycosyltransferase involved in cell wall biosynthesis